jgi:hypothetical protein
MFVPVIVIAFVTNNGIVISALAVGSGSSGEVIQEAVNTGNHELDKQVNKLYDCVSKITHEPQEPGKAEVDNCYFQIFRGSIDNSRGITLPSNESPLSVSNVKEVMKIQVRAAILEIADRLYAKAYIVRS